jgi:hypothetical protein
MRGSIQKKGKRWYAVVHDGVNPQTGQYRRRWVPAGSGRGDAEKLLAELVKRSHQGETVVSEKLTLGEYLTTRWLPVQQARLRTSTYDSYRRNIDLHVIPALGERLLDQLTVEDIDVFYATLLTSGDKRTCRGDGRKGMSPKSVHNIHAMLNKALGDAASPLQNALPDEAGGFECPLLREVVDFGDGLEAVSCCRREQVVGAQLMRSAAGASPSMLGQQHDSDLDLAAQTRACEVLTGRPCPQFNRLIRVFD